MDTCRSEPLGGGRCELAAGHDGKHRKTNWPYGPEGKPFVFEWDDESQGRLAERSGT